MAKETKLKINNSDDIDDKLVAKTSLLNDFEYTDNLTFDSQFEGVPVSDLLPGTFNNVDSNKGLEMGATTTVGYMQSKNFVTGTTGWRLDTDGNFEGSSGTFRGTLTGNSINIPNTTSPKFTVTSAGLMTSSNYSLIQEYTAGENITAGRLVCFKRKECTWGDGTTSDSYNTCYDTNGGTGILSSLVQIYEGSTGTNYYNTTGTQKLGSDFSGPDPKQYWLLGKIDLTSVPPGLPDWNEVESVKLRLYVVFAASSQNVTLQRLTAAFVENSVTWATAPAIDVTTSWSSSQVCSGEVTPGTLASTADLADDGYIEFDITNLFRLWASETYTNHGFILKASSDGTSGAAQIGARLRSGGGEFNQAPFLVTIITKSNPGSGHTFNAINGSIYHSNSASYNEANIPIGISAETKSSGETTKVYSLVSGTLIPNTVLDVSADIGSFWYQQGTAGEIIKLTNDIINNDTNQTNKWSYKIGMATANGLVLDFDKRYILIKSENMPTVSGVVGSISLFPPPFASKVVINHNIELSDSFGTIRRQTTLFKDSLVSETQTEVYRGGGFCTITSTWSGGTTGTLTLGASITDGGAGPPTVSTYEATLYWYKLV